MIYINNIDDLKKLTPQDILTIFMDTKIYKRYLKNAWAGKTGILKRFYNPIFFLDWISKEITNAVNSVIDEDYWLLILGEPGTGKSTLSMAIYKYIMKNLGYADEQIKENIYLDVCYLPYDYLGRIALHNEQIQEKGKPFPYPIILDEAHNMFDLFAEGSTAVIRKILQRIYEIREWRLIHIINTQIPQQLARRSRYRFHSLIILWKEFLNFEKGGGTHIKQAYKSYVQNVLGEDISKDKKGYFLWGAFYEKDKAHRVLRWIIKKDLSIEELRPILLRFTPDIFFPMTFLLHETSNLREAYAKVKLYNSTIKTLYDSFGVRGLKRSIFLKTLIELSKNFDKIDPNKIDNKGFIELKEPVSVEIDDKDDYKILKKIGKAKIILDIEKEEGKKGLDHRKAISEYYYVNIYSINPKIYNFLKNMRDVMEKRHLIHKAVEYRL